MQRMFDPKCSPKEYQKKGKSFSFPDLSKEICPQCKAGLLKQHGFYDRWLHSIGFEGEISIRRYICLVCGKTVSLLPSFAHSKMAHGIEFIMGILKLFYLGSLSIAQAIKSFHETTGLCCSRQLFRQFRLRFQNNLQRLIMESIALFKWQTPPVTAPADEKRQRARQFLECIQSLNSDEVSLKLFERSRTTLLAAHAN